MSTTPCISLFQIVCLSLLFATHILYLIVDQVHIPIGVSYLLIYESK